MKSKMTSAIFWPLVYPMESAVETMREGVGVEGMCYRVDGPRPAFNSIPLFSPSPNFAYPSALNYPPAPLARFKLKLAFPSSAKLPLLFIQTLLLPLTLCGF